MIVRVVRMEFKTEHIDDFKNLFENKKEKIRTFPGCEYLELIQGLDAHSNVFLTYSHWQTEKDLENYRYSELFQATWKETKAMFSAKPSAISTHRLHKLS